MLKFPLIYKYRLLVVSKVNSLFSIDFVWNLVSESLYLLCKIFDKYRLKRRLECCFSFKIKARQNLQPIIK